MSIPKLRFRADDGSGFPEWEEKRLDEVVDFLDAQRKPLEAGERVAGPYPYYGASGIIDYVKDYIFDDELILLSEDGANIIDRNYRVAFLAKGKFWVNNHAHVLKAINGNVNYFVCEELETFDYKKYNSGGAQPKLNQATCRLIMMHMPVISEQQKIASFLSTIDEIITTTQSELTAWEERKKGVMQKIFNREVRFKADDGSEFPEWEEKRLGAVCQYGKSHGTGLNYIGTENMLSAFGGVIIENTKLECNGILYSSGDVLMSNIRPYLKKVWLADREGVCSTDVLVFRPIKIESAYLYCLIASDSFITKVMSAAKGSKMPRGDKKHIMEMSVFIPCRLEQCKIADCLASLNDVISQIQAELSAWKGFKKGLLQQMFV